MSDIGKFSFIFLAIIFSTSCKESISIDGSKSSDEPIIGITWKLASIDTINGGVQAIYSGQEYTLLIKEDSTASGRSHCNLYEARVRLGNGTITFFDLAETEMWCRPPSLDGEYIHALLAASHYRVSGQKLKIFYNNQQNVLNFTGE
ncbi:MAG: META domain-containing protein [Calditrichaceae bacterium]|nr:META domain-containing protein [Calditrichia bacterium]NUQ44060.1 META domain-containing protein [Calditrichaceae bacterium]